MWNGRITGSSNFGMDAIASDLRDQLRQLADIEKQRAELTVSAATPDMRVTATVDAAGHLIDLEFSKDIAKLTYAEIATAVLATTRQAVEEVTRRSGELFEPLNEQRARMPSLSEMFEDFPEIDGPLSAAVEEVARESGVVEEQVDVVAQRANESLVAAHPDEEDLAMEFDETVEIAGADDPGIESAVADRGWE